MRVLALLTLLVACVAGVPAPLSDKPQLDGRIVGGSTTTIQNYPYQVSLQYGGSHICGGSIISANYVLTAAHCIIGSASQHRVRVGSTNSNSGGTIYQVAQTIVHGSYSSRTMDYDVALLRTSTAISGSSSVATIGLESGVVSVGTSAVVTGWGTTSEGGSASTTLRQVIVPIVSDASCNSAYASYGGITARMICAGYTSGGRDACQGDSGGPLVANGRLVGVVSWGVGCARPNFPGVYAKVSAVRSWIQSNFGV
uniref:Serine protease n=1 Tax=Eupolyphaga sinensis TaxID=367774 RepID=G9B5F1_9NEOP|nr:serine protease [Eupolyphaga sinensis]